MRRFLTRWLALGMLVPAAAALMAMTLAGLAPGVAHAQAAAQPTPTEATYFADTAPFRANLVRNQQWLENIVKAMQTGHADEVSTDELSNLSRELYKAKRGFADAEASERLWDYDRLVKASLDRSYTATVMLLHAQVTESGPDHDALVRDAAIYTASAGTILNDAANALLATSLAIQ
jgi:hypothetical protein